MASFQFSHPEKFDFAKPQGWEKWFQRFERFRSASGLSEKQEEIQVNSLIYCMGSEADDILDTLKLTAEQKKKYETVSKKLKDYFIPKRNVIFERVQFHQRVQFEGENVDSFVTSLYKLAEYCSFGELHDEMIRDRLVVGLRDQRVSEKLQLDAELTLEKALTQARQHEAVKAQQPVVRGQKVDSSSLDAVQGKKGQTKPKTSMIRDSEG
ncbi:MAG: hypothetical protein N0E48_23435 [Candidatus Thiodiazotropha endolucinida]|nr:hypothetical protein [Candidatus Thiodiazotropha taylori]MCW4346286.1 hypothetical protein [Candidatus Thiodiazotropha endolucinida]